ncbi:MAG: zf-HC2 domain-containing protein [Acidobacteriales bacterium]|nr:zf-HC2 domain-containing protein [Terriglobales bacterium]
MKCKDFLNELNDFLDGSLDPKLKAELEDHLVWCHHCYVVCDTTKKTIQIYRENDVYELPDPIRERLQTAIMQKCKAKQKSE